MLAASGFPEAANSSEQFHLRNAKQTAGFRFVVWRLQWLGATMLAEWRAWHCKLHPSPECSLWCVFEVFYGLVKVKVGSKLGQPPDGL